MNKREKKQSLGWPRKAASNSWDVKESFGGISQGYNTEKNDTTTPEKEKGRYSFHENKTG